MFTDLFFFVAFFKNGSHFSFLNRLPIGKKKIHLTGYISVKWKYSLDILYCLTFWEPEKKLCFTLKSVSLKFPPIPKRFDYSCILQDFQKESDGLRPVVDPTMQVRPVQPNQRYENKRRGPTSNLYVTRVIRDGGRGGHKGRRCNLQLLRWLNGNFPPGQLEW